MGKILEQQKLPGDISEKMEMEERKNKFISMASHELNRRR